MHRHAQDPAEGWPRGEERPCHSGGCTDADDGPVDREARAHPVDHSGEQLEEQVGETDPERRSEDGAEEAKKRRCA